MDLSASATPATQQDEPYFKTQEARVPPLYAPLSARRRLAWHFLAGASVASGTSYLIWRWTVSLNPDALGFSVLVAGAETLFFLGTLLFYFDIWDEGDTANSSPPVRRAEIGGGEGPSNITVDVFITTFDELPAVVAPSIADALALEPLEDLRVLVWLLDDGDRPEMAALARKFGIGYCARQDNIGFKAGNLRNGLFHTSGDFVVICDADTRLFPTFLQNTLGYFRDPDVAWVQTPHWFYDIPEGKSWEAWLKQSRLCVGRSDWRERGAQVLAWLTGRTCIGKDPFLADPTIFFDVIQRRRNRNGASFCCGAASVHRREAIFAAAIRRKTQQVLRPAHGISLPAQQSLAAHPIEPYRFHVSEDLYTSILLHEDQERTWRSVYHPQVEARMLSPVSLEAWAAQRLKYAGGTFDIALRDNPLFRRGLSWRQRLHYGATFWSYMSALWAPVLLLAPAFSLVTGITPVTAYSLEFFAYFLPAVVLGEVAMLAACKGHSIGAGRTLSVAGLPIVWHALVCVLRGHKPKFAPTPKLPVLGKGMRFVVPHIFLLVGMMLCGAIGIWRTLQGDAGFSASLLWVNLFWLGVNMVMVAGLLRTVFWQMPTPKSAHTNPDPLEETDAARSSFA
ncbi:glycosyltransferase [Shimia sp. R10_1]|uniref:glycosyltransferase family 2 protein n=1 Tax=Shimia sp. R10_1 TaxID=2821095 RepID=UPI001AD9937C|nr:cellulose synthase catalytic subunit [Shimia sp. R10_1]MBO9475418.1 glycosyltransferase [Shimia sp. R10_1]